MEVTFTAIERFSAGHQLSMPARCMRRHGHAYRVEVTIGGSPDLMNGWLAGSDTLEPALTQLADELRDSDLAEMLPGVRPNVHGLAAWFMERLLLGHPNVIRVSITEDDRVRAVAERQIR